jgi:DNA-binding transcriptional ArsR family regulator
MTGPKDGREDRGGQSRYRRAAMRHPVRRRIARRLADGKEESAGELAAALDEALGGIAFHLRVLVRHGVLEVVPKCNPAPPLYRWAPDAQWARDMLVDEGDEGD